MVSRIADRWITLDAEHSNSKAIPFSCQLSDPNVFLEQEPPEISRGASATVDGQPAIMSPTRVPRAAPSRLVPMPCS